MNQQLRGWYIGITAASQAAEAGSTPVPRSIKVSFAERQKGLFAFAVNAQNC